MPTKQSVIAVLDDEPEMRKALRRLLASRGFRVEEYACSENLFADLEGRTLDCLLLDLHMPGTSGFDVLKAFQIRHIQVPVIVITAYDEADTADRVHALGASAYLKKPVDRDTLLAAIEAAKPRIQAL